MDPVKIALKATEGKAGGRVTQVVVASVCAIAGTNICSFNKVDQVHAREERASRGAQPSSGA